NSVKHLQAVAAEAECPVDVYRLFETLADDVPLLTAIRPNGETPIEEFDDAARAAARRQRADGHRADRRGEPRRGHGRRRSDDPAAGAGARAAAHDRA